MAGILLLNADYSALRVISINRAVGLMFADRVEVLEETGKYLRSAKARLPCPSVIRLKTYVRIPYRARIPLNRKNLMARDNGRCAYCAKPGNTIDHVVPRSKHGRHEWTNVVIACRGCNQRKGDRSLSDLGWDLLTVPRVPNRWLVVGLTHPEPEWLPYLDASIERVA